MENGARYRVRGERIVVKDAGGEVVLYDLDTHRVHLLNPLASAVWRLAPEDVTITELCDGLSQQGWGLSSAEPVEAVLAQLDGAGLLHASVPQDLRRISRRTVLKAAGAAAVALPAITTILAPTPAAAGSHNCTANGGTCTQGSQCCSGFCSAGTCATCTQQFQTCTTSSQCCGGTCTAVGASTSYCCKDDNAVCTPGSTTECCSGTCTASGFCPLCASTGASCSQTEPYRCCSGTCVNGVCA